MVTPIQIRDAIEPPSLEAGSPAKSAGGAGEAFADVFKRASAAESNATDAAQRFASGDPAMGIHEVMIASEKANIAVRYAVTLKNKALDAYRELMNTPL